MARRTALVLAALGLVAGGVGCGDSSSDATTTTAAAAPATTQATETTPTSTADQPVRDAAATFWGGVGKGKDAIVRQHASSRCDAKALALAKAARAAGTSVAPDKLKALGDPTQYVTRGQSATYVEVAQITGTAAAWTRWRFIDQQWRWDGCEGGDGPPAAQRPKPVKGKAKVLVAGVVIQVTRVRFRKIEGTSRRTIAITLRVDNGSRQPVPPTAIGSGLKFAVMEHAASSQATQKRQICFGDNDHAFDTYGLWCAENTNLTLPQEAQAPLPPGQHASLTVSGPDPSATHRTEDLLLRFANQPLRWPAGS